MNFDVGDYLLYEYFTCIYFQNLKVKICTTKNFITCYRLYRFSISSDRSTRRFFFFKKYKNVSINPFQSTKTNILGTSICTRQVIIHKIHGRSRRTCTKKKNVYEFMVKYRFLCNPVYCIVIKRAYYYQCVLHPSCTPSLSPPPLLLLSYFHTPMCCSI